MKISLDPLCQIFRIWKNVPFSLPYSTVSPFLLHPMTFNDVMRVSVRESDRDKRRFFVFFTSEVLFSFKKRTQNYTKTNTQRRTRTQKFFLKALVVILVRNNESEQCSVFNSGYDSMQFN